MREVPLFDARSGPFRGKKDRFSGAGAPGVNNFQNPPAVSQARPPGRLAAVRGRHSEGHQSGQLVLAIFIDGSSLWIHNFLNSGHYNVAAVGLLHYTAITK